MPWNVAAVMSPRLRSRSFTALEVGTRATVEAMKELAPIDSGQLVSSISAEPVHPSGDRFSTKITATSQHADWVYHGTGIYGPRGTPITPVRSPVLTFIYNGEEIHTKNVLGQRFNKDWFDGPLKDWKGLVAEAFRALR